MLSHRCKFTTRAYAPKENYGFCQYFDSLGFSNLCPIGALTIALVLPQPGRRPGVG